MGERAIAVRGRGNYQIAVRYVRRMRDLYRRLGEAAGWQTHITHLRREHRHLHALQDELDRAGM